MPRCKRCGTRISRAESNYDGYCKPCRKSAASQKKAEAQALLERNHTALKEHRGRPALQRIYDSFVEQYPNALITGIAVPEMDKKLLIYLDGEPAYYATFDPLDNAAKLSKYVPVTPDPAKTSPTLSIPRSSHRWTLYAGIVLLVLSVVGFIRSSDSSDGASSKATSTARPTPTATAIAPADDIVSWASYYAEKYMPDDMALDTVETSISVGETYLTIACNMDVMLDSEAYLRSATELICKVGPAIRNRSGYDHVSFLFYGPFIDKYGNSIQSLGIRAMYSLEELQIINFEYFYSRRYTDPTAVIKTNNDYLIHPSYLD